MSKILLVDDDVPVLMSMKTLLHEQGYDVTGKQNAEEARELLKTEEFDLMLTDIRMSPMDGMHLLKAAKEIRQEMPVIVVSAVTSDKMIEEASDAGAFEYIKKPFKIDDILGAINRALGE